MESTFHSDKSAFRSDLGSKFNSSGNHFQSPPDKKFIWVRFRKRLGQIVVDNFFKIPGYLGSYLPFAWPSWHKLQRIKDVSYLDTGLAAHRLDIYRPKKFKGLLPVVIYMHGGAFRIMSKDTHWLMGLAFARRKCLVFTLNYRLAPQYPFPAALEDVCAAYIWILKNAAHFGGATDNVVLAGESAGANLATALTLTACYQRPEIWAQKVFAAGVVPKVVVPVCGIFQVTEIGRFNSQEQMSPWVFDRLAEVPEAYLPPEVESKIGNVDLADPVVFLEQGQKPDRPLPPFFIPVGTSDPLIDDTRRLEKAIKQLGSVAEARYYQGGMHAFFAFVWLAKARQCWRDIFAFMAQHLPAWQKQAAFESSQSEPE